MLTAIDRHHAKKGMAGRSKVFLALLQGKEFMIQLPQGS
jgi:hypothetical protein